MWTEHLSTRIFNRSKIRLQPCEHNLYHSVCAQLKCACACKVVNSFHPFWLILWSKTEALSTQIRIFFTPPPQLFIHSLIKFFTKIGESAHTAPVNPLIHPRRLRGKKISGLKNIWIRVERAWIDAENKTQCKLDCRAEEMAGVPSSVPDQYSGS